MYFISIFLEERFKDKYGGVYRCAGTRCMSLLPDSPSPHLSASLFIYWPKEWAKRREEEGRMHRSPASSFSLTFLWRGYRLKRMGKGIKTSGEEWNKMLDPLECRMWNRIKTNNQEPIILKILINYNIIMERIWNEMHIMADIIGICLTFSPKPFLDGVKEGKNGNWVPSSVVRLSLGKLEI